jgi:hypothetical protein
MVYYGSGIYCTILVGPHAEVFPCGRTEVDMECIAYKDGYKYQLK